MIKSVREILLSVPYWFLAAMLAAFLLVYIKMPSIEQEPGGNAFVGFVVFVLLCSIIAKPFVKNA